MGSMGIGFGIAAIVVIAIIAAIAGFKMEQARRNALQALAESNGWKFDPSTRRGRPGDLALFDAFDRGRDREASNTIRGQVEIDGMACAIQLGDFQYDERNGSGEDSTPTTYRFSYAIITLPFSSPSMVIRREGMFDKFKAMFGFEDIDFESAEFSRKFHVSSEDKRFAYDLCDPRMIEYLLGAGLEKIEIAQGRICYVANNRWKPEQFSSELTRLEKFVEHIPRHVRATQEAG